MGTFVYLALVIEYISAGAACACKKTFYEPCASLLATTQRSYTSWNGGGKRVCKNIREKKEKGRSGKKGIFGLAK